MFRAVLRLISVRNVLNVARFALAIWRARKATQAITAPADELLSAEPVPGDEPETAPISPLVIRLENPERALGLVVELADADTWTGEDIRVEPYPAEWRPAHNQWYTPTQCRTEWGVPRQVQYVIIHVAEGTAEGTAAWFASPASQGATHYTVGMKGHVMIHVSEENAAWHCGHHVYNARSIGIEHAGYVHSLLPSYEQYNASAELVANICVRHNIPVTRDWILGHAEVPGHHPPHTDPGPNWDWDLYLRFVREHHARLTA